MKNKLKKTMTALCAALILVGGFSVPAYAQGTATEPPAEDATNDSNVIVEEKEETPPLTPKGNAKQTWRAVGIWGTSPLRLGRYPTIAQKSGA